MNRGIKVLQTSALPLGYVAATVICHINFVEIDHRAHCCALQSHLAIRIRLELTTSSVTGWHSNQLNYRTVFGGSYRARTCDPLLVRQMLSQLS